MCSPYGSNWTSKGYCPSAAINRRTTREPVRPDYDEALPGRADRTERGHSTCSMLRDRESRALISQKLMGVEPQLAFQMAMQFTNVVTSAYPNCP